MSAEASVEEIFGKVRTGAVEPTDYLSDSGAWERQIGGWSDVFVAANYGDMSARFRVANKAVRELALAGADAGAEGARYTDGMYDQVAASPIEFDEIDASLDALEAIFASQRKMNTES